MPQAWPGMAGTTTLQQYSLQDYPKVDLLTLFPAPAIVFSQNMLCKKF